MPIFTFLSSAVIANQPPSQHTQPKNVRPNKPRRHAIHQNHRKIHNFNQTGSDADLRIISTRSASSPHQRSPSDTDTFGPRSMVSPVNKSPTSRSLRNPQGIQHGTRRKANDSRIHEAPHCSRGTTFHNNIPGVSNNSPLGDGDAHRGRLLNGVRLSRDQSVIGLNRFPVVFRRRFRLILGLKLRHLRLLRTLSNRLRCGYSLPC